jgi:hypothetical protein
LLAGAAEVSGEFHFLVADLCDLGDRTVEVVFHQVAYGVELHTDFFDAVFRGGPAEFIGEKRGGGDGGRGLDGGLHELAAVDSTHGVIILLGVRRELYSRGEWAQGWLGVLNSFTTEGTEEHRVNRFLVQFFLLL